MAQGQAAAPGRGGTQDGALLACILDMGELLLTSGAEVMRVEDTLTRLCMVYGFCAGGRFYHHVQHRADGAHTGGARLITRRIRARDTDLGRVERVNALSRRLCAGPLPPEKFRQAVEEVPMPRLTRTPPSAPCTPLSQRRSPSFSAARYATLRRRPFRASCCSARCALPAAAAQRYFAEYAGQRAGSTGCHADGGLRPGPERIRLSSATSCCSFRALR